MIICSSSNIDLIQGVSGYGTVSDGATDWRIENTATGVFNILNSPNLLTPNVSIIDAGNIGIGTIPVSGTNKLQVQGNLNVSGGYFVAGVAFKPATAVLADTATALATSRNINGVAFNGSANIDITLPYFNLTNKITAGNGISLTTGSATTSPVIASSQWVTTGGNIYYNTGNVGIGNSNIESSYKLKVEGSTWITNQLVFFDSFRGAGADYACNKIAFYGAGNTPTTTANNGLGLSNTGIEYFSYTNHAFYTGTTGGTGYGTERMRITSTGIVTINSITSRMITVNCLTSGSLLIGNQNQSYGGNIGEVANMACLVLECAANTEIMVHHYGTAYHSFMRYTTNAFTIGRSTGVGTVASVFKGNNGTAWDVTSDHRIKENVKKANLTICYDNVKNINLYRFNYTKAFGNDTHKDRTQLGFIAQQVNLYYPKSITRGKRKLDDNKDVPDLASIDITQVNFTLFGAVKQLIRVVEKQSIRIKKLEEMLNIVTDDEVENDADEPYVKIVCEGEVDIDSIVPSEPEENISSSNTSNVF